MKNTLIAAATLLTVGLVGARLAGAEAIVVPAPTDAAIVEVAGAATEVLYSGNVWVKKSAKITGGWKIVKDGDKHYVELDGTFSTSGAPDLKLFLSPLSASEVANKTATSGSLFIAKLSSNKGAQRYEIPAGTDFSAYKSLIIHCEEFTKLWGGADLLPAA